MDNDRKKILEMLASGKIDVEEAERLLAALQENSSEADESLDEPSQKKKWKYLRIQVEPTPESTDNDRVNIRVPFNLIRAGLKLAAFIPKHTQHKVDEALKEKGFDINFDNLTTDDIDELLTELNDLEVEVDGDEKVRIFCE